MVLAFSQTMSSRKYLLSFLLFVGLFMVLFSSPVHSDCGIEGCSSNGGGGGTPNTLPTINVTHSPVNPTSSTRITFNATARDIDAGDLLTILVYVDNQTAGSCGPSISPLSCNITAGPYSAGSHTYYATANDGEATNTSATGTFIVTGSSVYCTNTSTQACLRADDNRSDPTTETINKADNLWVDLDVIGKASDPKQVVGAKYWVNTSGGQNEITNIQIASDVSCWYYNGVWVEDISQRKSMPLTFAGTVTSPVSTTETRQYFCASNHTGNLHNVTAYAINVSATTRTSTDGRMWIWINYTKTQPVIDPIKTEFVTYAPSNSTFVRNVTLISYLKGARGTTPGQWYGTALTTAEVSCFAFNCSFNEMCTNGDCTSSSGRWYGPGNSSGAIATVTSYPDSITSPSQWSLIASIDNTCADPCTVDAWVKTGDHPNSTIRKGVTYNVTFDISVTSSGSTTSNFSIRFGDTCAPSSALVSANKWAEIVACDDNLPLKLHASTHSSGATTGQISVNVDNVTIKNMRPLITNATTIPEVINVTFVHPNGTIEASKNATVTTNGSATVTFSLPVRANAGSWRFKANFTNLSSTAYSANSTHIAPIINWTQIYGRLNDSSTGALIPTSTINLQAPFVINATIWNNQENMSLEECRLEYNNSLGNITGTAVGANNDHCSFSGIANSSSVYFIPPINFWVDSARGYTKRFPDDNYTFMNQTTLYTVNLAPNSTMYRVGEKAVFTLTRRNVRGELVSSPVSVFNISDNSSVIQYINTTSSTTYEYQFNSSSPNGTWTARANISGSGNSGTNSTTFILNSTVGTISQCGNNTVDQCPRSEVNGYVYYKKFVTITNAGSTARTFLVENQCPSDRAAWTGAGQNDSFFDDGVSANTSNCQTQTSNLSAAQSKNFTFRWRKTGVVNSTNGSWEVDSTRSSNSTIQYVRKQINVTNSDSNNGFDAVLTMRLPETSLGGETCLSSGNSTHCNATLTLFAGGSVTNFLINISGDWIPGQTPAFTWGQDTRHTSTQTQQYIRKPVEVTTGTTGLTGVLDISWSETIQSSSGKGCREGWTSNTTSGVLKVAASGGSNSTNATGYGDCVNETTYGWIQDTTKSSNLSNQSVGQFIQFANLETDFGLTGLSWSSLVSLPSGCESGATCAFTRQAGTVTLTASQSLNDTANATGDWIANSTSSWIQDTVLTTVAGGTAYVSSNISHNSSGIGINFTSVAYSCQGRSGWTLTQSGGTTSVTTNHHNISKACNATKSNAVTKTEQSWTQNTTPTSNLDKQHVRKQVDVNNTDSEIAFSGVSWSTSVDSAFTGEISSGTTDVSALGSSTVFARASGDILNETVGEYRDIPVTTPEVDATSGVSARNLTVVNNHSTISLTSITTNLTNRTPTSVWTCENSLTISASADQTQFISRAKNCTSGTQVVRSVNGTNWRQNTTNQSDTDGFFWIEGDINITNDDNVAYPSLLYTNSYGSSARSRSGWTCATQTGTITVPAGPGSFVQTSNKPITCYRSGSAVATKIIGAEENLRISAGKCLYRHQKWVNVTNNDTLDYNNVKTSVTFSNFNGSQANISKCASGLISVNSTNYTTWNINLSASGGVSCLLNWSANELKPVIVNASSNNSATKAKAPVVLTFFVQDEDSPGTAGKLLTNIRIEDTKPQRRDAGECSFNQNGSLNCTYTVPALDNTKDAHLIDADGEEGYWTLTGTAEDDTGCPSELFSGKFLVDRQGPRVKEPKVTPASRLVKINDYFNITNFVEDINLTRVELWVKPKDSPGEEFKNIQNYTGGQGNVTFNISLTDLNQTYGTTTGTRVRWYLKAVDVAGNERKSAISNFFVSCETNYRLMQFTARPVSVLTGQTINDATVTLTLVDKENPSTVIVKETEVEDDGSIITSLCTEFGKTLVSGKTYKLIVTIKTPTEKSYHIEDFTAP